MILLDGVKVSEIILREIKNKIEEKKLKLKLAVVLVGNNPASKSYINKKKEACDRIGIDCAIINYPENIEENILTGEIKKLADDNSVSGIVIQLPLPKSFSYQKILNLIPTEKDPDVLSGDSFLKFSKGELNIMPPVVSGIKRLFDENNISIIGKKIIVIGKGKLVGRPLSVWLLNNKADFFVADRSVDDISLHTKTANIIISGAGVPGLVKEDMVKDGVVLVDAGTSSEEGRVRGDIDPGAYKKASYAAMVPGGVGPMTVACLLENLVKLTRK